MPAVKKITINMDNRSLRVSPGLTILQAAERNGVYIPTLCAHAELSPFGGCRMCIVEVEGMRGFPTACTTPVQEGMIVRTGTAGVQAERREILQLILSEHTSSCLICEERDGCRENMTTIRKAGVTTGCRYCPNDEGCELQDVVDYLEIQEIEYPISYRHLPVENDDPFYDRDYNLCILCGRCIRMCQEIRTANVLAFKQRGRQTVIGPAFQRTHLEAGCEFCGACVSVCPTGALAERNSKWDGASERSVTTTCALCGLGCQLDLQVKDDRVISSLPADDDLVNRGQLCVKGRFCVSSLVNGSARLKKPYSMENGTRVELSWREALELAAEKLKDCPPNRFAMIVSADGTNEDLYTAQKFTRQVMGSDRVDSSARLEYGPVLNDYLRLFSRPVPLSRLGASDTILAIGLDTRYGRSVAGVEIRRALSCGARLATIHPRDHHLARSADLWLQPEPGGELDMIDELTRETLQRIGSRGRGRKRTVGKDGWKGPKDRRIRNAGPLIELLTRPGETVILVGPEVLAHGDGKAILKNILRLAEGLGAGVMPLPAQGNLMGAFLMGACPELLPGGRDRREGKQAARLERQWGAALPGSVTRWNAALVENGPKPKVLYLIGEMLPKAHQLADFVIFQSIYPPDDPRQADLVLPAAAFTESEGTFFSGQGRLQRVRRAVRPPGRALPDWDILSRLARAMGREEAGFRGIRQIQKEINRCAGGRLDLTRPDRRVRPLSLEARLRGAGVRQGTGLGGRLPYVLYATAEEDRHREVPLRRIVDDAAVILPVEQISVNPEDARRQRIAPGDRVTVSRGRLRWIWPVRITGQQPPGTLHVHLPAGQMPELNPLRVRLERYR
jgi:predicted molibdopterin-dependent oxidoreductase YjgC